MTQTTTARDTDPAPSGAAGVGLSSAGAVNTDTLRQVSELLATVDVDRFAGLPRADQVALTIAYEAVGRLLACGQVALAGVLAHESRRELGTGGLAHGFGERSPSNLLQRLTGVSGAEAARRIRTAALVLPRQGLGGAPLPALFPQVGAALSSGMIGLDAATGIAARLHAVADRCTVDDIEAAERALVVQACGDGISPMAADLIAGQARAWVTHLDASGVEPREDEQHAQSDFRIGRVGVGGMTRSVIVAPPEQTAQLRTAMEAFINPRTGVAFCAASEHEHDGDATGEHDRDAAVDDTELLRDPRTTGQRNFDVLFGLLTAGLTNTDVPRVQGATATVTAVVTLQDLMGGAGAGAGWLDEAEEPVSVRTLRRMVCDGGMATLVIGDNGHPLHLGMTERNFSTAQRRAMAARDGGCVWPGCTAPPSWCDAHHIRWWHRNGPTDIDNGVLLCPFHHRLLQTSDWVLESIDGRAHLIAPKRLDSTGRPRPLGRSPVAPPQLW